MEYSIKNRFTNRIIYTCAIPPETEDKSEGEKLGYAVKKAVIEGIDLRDANLQDVNLRSANLQSIKEDFFKRLSLNLKEARGLYDLLVQGKINGSVYKGECACFVGSIANLTGQDYGELISGLRPDCDSPTERWFLAIQEGHTPENNQVSAITAEWMMEFMKQNGIAVPGNGLLKGDYFANGCELHQQDSPASTRIIAKFETEEEAEFFARAGNKAKEVV